MNARDAWKGLNVMMGRTTQQQRLKCSDPVKFVNEMNTFYACFDDKDFRNKCNDLCQSLDHRKAPGSDGLKGKVLKVCTTQLGSVFTCLWSEGKGFESMYHSVRECFYTPVPAFVVST